jgi:hypothetical protein
MIQMYDPKQMLVRRAVFDAIRLARCKDDGSMTRAAVRAPN